MRDYVFSFFSGAGFLDLGFERQGFEIVYVNEIHEPFLRAYKHSRSVLGIDQPKYGYALRGIDDINLDELRSFVEKCRSKGRVGFIGGPPCPDFSIAGKQAGRDGKNGQLSDSYITLICEIEPDWFVFENVKGLWSTRKHREYYNELRKRVESSNYYVADKLCNAIGYGAPQDRDRVILFGSKKPFTAQWHMKDPAEIKSMNWPDREPFSENSERPCPSGIDKTLTVQYWFDLNDVENHPNANRHFMPRAGLSKMQTVDEGDVSKKSYKRLHRWRYSPTVAYGNNEVHLHPYKVRRLDVSEALALQSLPKEYELPNDMSLSDSFKTVGNGVPYLLAYGIAGEVKGWLG